MPTCIQFWVLKMIGDASLWPDPHTEGPPNMDEEGLERFIERLKAERPEEPPEQAQSEAPETVEHPPYVAELGEDLGYLIEMGHVLVSVPARDITPWFEGHRNRVLTDTPNLYDGLVKLVNEESGTEKDTDETTKEYEVKAPSGTSYTFVVKTRVKHQITANEVKIRFTKIYNPGVNPQKGVLVGSSDHDVLYLLPLIARLPLDNISYDAVVDFLEKHNGFKYSIRRPDSAQFQDQYKYERRVQKLSASNPSYKGAMIIKNPVSSSHDVYVNVEKLEDGRVKLELEVAIPKKNVRSGISRVITKPTGKP